MSLPGCRKNAQSVSAIKTSKYAHVLSICVNQLYSMYNNVVIEAKLNTCMKHSEIYSENIDLKRHSVSVLLYLNIFDTAL